MLLQIGVNQGYGYTHWTDWFTDMDRMGMLVEGFDELNMFVNLTPIL